MARRGRARLRARAPFASCASWICLALPLLLLGALRTGSAQGAGESIARGTEGTVCAFSGVKQIGARQTTFMTSWLETVRPLVEPKRPPCSFFPGAVPSLYAVVIARTQTPPSPSALHHLRCSAAACSRLPLAPLPPRSRWLTSSLSLMCWLPCDKRPPSWTPRRLITTMQRSFAPTTACLRVGWNQLEGLKARWFAKRPSLPPPFKCVVLTSPPNPSCSLLPFLSELLPRN